MADIDQFVESPSYVLLNKCTKEQLLKIAEYYEVKLSDKRIKESSIKTELRNKLVDKKVLTAEMSESDQHVKSLTTQSALTFDQQKELLLLQMEHEKIKQKSERDKIELDKARMDLQYLKLKLIEEGKVGDVGSIVGQSEKFPLNQSLKLVPKFNEVDPDVFFTMFERVAVLQGWSKTDCVLLLQSVLVGKAQLAFAALSTDDCRDYETVKFAVLKAYECVPETYRQRFRSCKKEQGQTHLEFVQDLRRHVTRWCASLKAKTFEELLELIIVEQFKLSVSDPIAMYISEHKIESPEAAALLADDFVLTHKNTAADWRTREVAANRVTYAGSQGGYFSSGKFDSSKICNYCRGKGHWKGDCPILKEKNKQIDVNKFKPAAVANSVHSSGAESEDKLFNDYLSTYAPFITEGRVSLSDGVEVPVRILRDTGAMDSFILESILPFSVQSETGNSVLVRGMGLNTLTVPLHKVKLHSDLVTGEVVVGLRPALPIEGVHLILGNKLAGDKVWPNASPSPMVSSSGELSEYEMVVDPVGVVTRAMAKSMEHLKPQERSELKAQHIFLPVPDLSSLPFPLSADDLSKEQRLDSTLDELFTSALQDGDVSDKTRGYFVQDGLLLRKWSPHGENFVGDPIVQVVVPTKFRRGVLEVAHEKSGHSGVRKTYDRVLQYFFWPHLKSNISTYIRSCHVCQVTSKPNQKLKPVPLHPISADCNPFEHLIVDCVGPMPPSKSGSKYLLTVMCLATRFPSAYPLRTITSRSIVRALSQFMSFFGIPKIIQSDQGTNLTSHLFQQVLKQLKIKHNLASVHHPQSQGALERFHQTLKSLLRAYCVQLDRDWEEGLPWLLLAARGVVHESTGFSPNDLVFGHKVRGLVGVLQSSVKISDSPKNLLSYVYGFRQRLIEARALARVQQKKQQAGMKRLYDRQVECRVFEPGDQVLVSRLLPSSPFEAKFEGPYVVKRKLSDENYEIFTPFRRKLTQLYHVNLLKPYYEKSNGEVNPVCSALLAVSGVGAGFCSGQMENEGKEPDDGILRGRLNNSESLERLNDDLVHLSPSQVAELSALLRSFPGLFGDTPSRTDWVEHDIDVGNASPVRQRYYRVSPEKRDLMEAEIRYMQENDIAVSSCSNWASPCLLVGKPDGSVRFCTDFRKVNAVTKPDCFPLPRVDDCVDQVGSARYVTKLDLLRGYWQVPLTRRAQEISSFITPSGLYSYKVMSFGLRNAPATFQRLMNRVVSGLEGCAVYLDDLVVFSDSWDLHLQRLHAVLMRLSEASLTVNLAKCDFARATVTYLGKVVGSGEVRPLNAKVQAIQEYSAPTTKRELMRFLGLVGYYRSFCCNFSSVVAPLTDLLKTKTKFIWSSNCALAFENVKSLLCSSSVLAAPCFERSFSLQVDASQVGAGAVLQQSDEQGVVRPVSFFSRKFNSYQLNYSVVEKEALALIWALQHFDIYVGSSQPVVIYTDHNPLTFLNSLHCPNQRLIRWSLFLQAYCLDIKHIRGSENVVADALSRSPMNDA